MYAAVERNLFMGKRFFRSLLMRSTWGKNRSKLILEVPNLSLLQSVMHAGTGLKRQDSELCNQTSGFIYNTGDMYICTVRRGEEGSRDSKARSRGEKRGTHAHTPLCTIQIQIPHRPLQHCAHSGEWMLNWEGSREDRFRSIQGRLRQTSEKHSGTQGGQQETKPGYTNTSKYNAPVRHTTPTRLLKYGWCLSAVISHRCVCMSVKIRWPLEAGNTPQDSHWWIMT